jgi:hypothetical protein
LAGECSEPKPSNGIAQTRSCAIASEARISAELVNIRNLAIFYKRQKELKIADNL